MIEIIITVVLSVAFWGTVFKQSQVAWGKRRAWTLALISVLLVVAGTVIPLLYSMYLRDRWFVSDEQFAFMMFGRFFFWGAGVIYVVLVFWLARKRAIAAVMSDEE